VEGRIDANSLIL